MPFALPGLEGDADEGYRYHVDLCCKLEYCKFTSFLRRSVPFQDLTRLSELDLEGYPLSFLNWMRDACWQIVMPYIGR